MKNLIIAFVLLFSIHTFSQNDVKKQTQRNHLPVNLSVFYPLSINKNDNEKLFKSDEGVKNQNMLQVRLIAGYEFLEKLSVFAGIGQNYAFDHDQNIADGKSEILFLAGLQLF